MRITLITPELHAELTKLSQDHPDLVFQNRGYEYIGREKREANAVPIRRIEENLKEHVVGFNRFHNFTHGTAGTVHEGLLVLRFDYDWGAEDGGRHFNGVGYLPLDHFRDGFPRGVAQATAAIPPAPHTHRCLPTETDPLLEALREKRARARYGEHRLVKIGTLSGQAAWVRPHKARGSKELVEGSYVEVRFGRAYGDKWQGPLKVWKATEGRLFLEWV